MKAGIVAGLVYGLILGVVSYFTFESEKSLIISSITSSLPANSPFTADQLYGIARLLAPVVAAVLITIGGIVVGAVYGWLFERIPGATPTVKGILVGVILWLLLSVLGGTGNLQYGVLVYLSGVGEALVGALLFGYLLGYFYGRFTRPPALDPAMQGL